jgi:hypothetical protein
MKIVFNYSGGFYAYLIRFFTKGLYTHCGIVIGDDLYQAQIFKGVYKKQWHPETWDVVYIDVSDKKTEKVKKFLEGELQSGYDWLGVLHFVFKWLKPSRKRWFCSELCAKALVEAGILNKKEKLIYFSPESLFRRISNKYYNKI